VLLFDWLPTRSDGDDGGCIEHQQQTRQKDQIKRQTDRQTGRQAERKRDREKERQREAISVRKSEKICFKSAKQSQQSAKVIVRTEQKRTKRNT